MALLRSHSKEEAALGREPDPRASKANVFCREGYKALGDLVTHPHPWPHRNSGGAIVITERNPIALRE